MQIGESNVEDVVFFTRNAKFQGSSSRGGKFTKSQQRENDEEYVQDLMFQLWTERSLVE
jgi:hypothetical protein